MSTRRSGRRTRPASKSSLASSPGKGMGSRSRSRYGSRKRSKKTQEEAARKIQGMIRKCAALDKIRKAVRSVYEKHYDETTAKYFYYNRVTGEAKWDKPYLLGEQDVTFNPWDELEDDDGNPVWYNQKTKERRFEKPPDLGLEWEENYDEQGRVFFYNVKTRQTSWEHPHIIQERERNRPVEWSKFKNEKGKFYYLDRASGKMMTEKEMKEKKKKEREEAEANEREAARARGETLDGKEEGSAKAGTDAGVAGKEAPTAEFDDISVLEHLQFSPEEWEEARKQAECVEEAIGSTGWSQYEQETEDEIRVFFYKDETKEFQWRQPPEVKKYRRKQRKEEERARMQAEKDALIPPWAKVLAKALEEASESLNLDGLLVEELEEEEEEEEEDYDNEVDKGADAGDVDEKKGEERDRKEDRAEANKLSLLREIPHKVIRKLKKFRHVYLARNGLREIGEKHLMKRLTHLETLDMSENEITHIPKSIMTLKSLTALSLSSNELEMLPIEFFHLDGLKSLKLAKNDLSELPLEMGVQTMREHRIWELGIGNLTQLTELDVSENKLTQLPEHREGSQRTAQFGNIESLEVLKLSKNQLQYLPEEFGRLVNLRSIEMAHNSLAELPESFEKLVKLEELDFSFNQIDKIDRGFCNLVNITQLNFRNNAVESLPLDFGALGKLKSIHASSNALKELPASIGRLAVLRHLHLSDNALIELPDSIGMLTCLEELYLDNNALRVLPRTLGQLKKLEILHLQHNGLVSRIDGLGYTSSSARPLRSTSSVSQPPSSVAVVESDSGAKSKDVTLQWGIPEELSNLSHLRTLLLHHNELSEIPKQYGMLAALTRLELNDNAITHLPKQIGHLRTLTHLLLHNNKLETLPDSIGKLTQIVNISLHNNRLQELPKHFKRLTLLEGVLDLSHNRFAEPPPMRFKLPNVVHVNLSFNPLKKPGVSAMEHKGRGDILFREGKLEEAAAQYTEALGKKEDYVDALAMRGLARKQQGHNEEAINDLSRAAELKHGDAFLSYNLGITYLERNDAKMAVSKFKEALNLIPHDVAALCGKGEAELCLGQFTNALVTVRLLEKTKMPNWNFEKRLALLKSSVLVKLGRTLEAIEELDKLIDKQEKVVSEEHSLFGMDYRPQLNRGLCYRDIDNHRGAIKDFGGALETLETRIGPFPGKDKVIRSIHMYRSSAYSSLGRKDDAEEDYNAFLRLQKGDKK